ncbi:DUF1643 domain-containing protein [Streptosporangium jomthongense]|uniref:DUF1643 domain-containing protein n=1 Tax=Streptosporangium jomthongense TaxID=1193683 RepID=A0ABV8F503_9ACTN
MGHTGRRNPLRATPDRVLCAILLNPPLRPAEETVTYRNVTAALSITGCQSLSLVNLLAVPSKDLPSLNQTPISAREIVISREKLRKSITHSDEVLVAWGMGGGTGMLRQLLKDQVTYVREVLREQGVRSVWTLEGKPRHPSRWHQYLGPQKNRVPGSSFQDRLNRALVPLLLDQPGITVAEDSF